MRAMPSFTSSAVPTSRTSISARSAAWISLRRISLSSPGLRMESVAMGCRLGDCESYHKSAECETQWGIRNAECGCSEGSLASRPPLYIPHSAFRIPHLVDWAFRTSYPRSRPSSYESLKHASRPHRPQFLRRRSRHTPRRARQVTGRGVAEDVHHRPHRVPGIPQQIGGARRACEGDDTFEVGSATGGELARQVLPRHPQRRRDTARLRGEGDPAERSEEHTSELQSRLHLVCRLLL